MPFSESRNLPQEVLIEQRESKILAASKEIIEDSLKSPEAIDGLRAWRGLDNLGSTAKKARRFFDNRAAEKRADLPIGALPKPIDRAEELLFLTADRSFSTRPEVARVFSNLSSVSSTEGTVNVFDLLSSDKVSFQTKIEWFRSRLLPALRFLQSRDLVESRGKAEAELELPPPSESDLIPPPSSDSLEPSMDEMEQSKEGENRGWFTVRPFYGGYYRGSDFEEWDAANLCWLKGQRKFTKLETIIVSEGARRVISGAAGLDHTDLPVPYGFIPDVRTLIPSSDFSIDFDGRGGYGLVNRSGAIARFSVELVSAARSLGGEGVEAGFGDFVLSAETENFLAEIKASNIPAADMARAVKQFVRKNLKYSNESAMNKVYRSGNPQEYFSRIEQNKKADCDVANTYFIALLSKLGIKARLISGHYVKTKDRAGSAVLSSGTAHAWSEVWDGTSWLRLDATPPGDPDMDDEETDEKPDNEINEGDFGEQEAEEISDQDLEKMIEKAKKDLAERAAAEAEAKEDPAAKFAKEAECSVEEARQVLSQIEAARGLRDKSGRLIRQRLSEEFRKIIRENLVEQLRYIAPVRMSEADDLDNPVEAWIDIKTGVADPSGFAKYRQEIKREQNYGGFDAIFVVDKSGSMTESDPQSGAAKWQGQQKFVFLFLDSLFAAADELRRMKIKLIGSLDVRVGLVSFAASGATIELPLSDDWKAKEQLTVWRSLQQNVGGGTPDHLGLRAAGKMLAVADETSGRRDKKRLQLVLVSADGGSDNKTATLSAKEKLKQADIVVKAAGIGAGARAIEAAYYPDGKNLSSFSEVADWAAGHVISEIQKLYPKKIKK